ncbi:MAG TPA: hypothetical protein VF557_12805 [Jatrophihabitans sp.]|jgi:hypothetical protein|uniref:hypothetical protein n=1 Tax=Jatrophihabitans sp. TaxID=1932789 RepID=UPI002EF446F9
MTKPSTSEQYELQAKIESFCPLPNSQMGPGRYFYWFLAYHIKASQVEFADVVVDTELSEFNARVGSVFVITGTGFIFAEYSGAADEESRDPSQDFGTVNITVHSKVPAPCESIKWTGRSLRIPKSNYGDGSGPARLEKGSIAVNGRGWNVLLPARSLDGADEYFDQLRTALGLSADDVNR